MKVLLVQDVKTLGKAGDLKEVKEGYGQNFLIAKGLAKLATDAVIRQWRSREETRIEREREDLERLKALAAKLESVTIKIVKKIGANGSLFGALKKEEIAQALTQNGFEIDKKDIETDGAIKATGLYEVSAKLGRGVHPRFKVEVAGE
ncbi:MAG: 50S ribosomal protein L9 [Helicobacteraceae bacterium]|jgi:large subunit ribosomal protein L9|nr:50S ribosomal protein L9 [Helicobacteraceae bacterium]